MSDDLISRKEVIKLIDEFGYVNCHNGKDFEANSRVDKIRQKIVEMSTACDSESMIEKLKETETDVLESIEENYRVGALVQLTVDGLEEWKKLFKCYTQEQIEIIKSATND